MNRGRPVIEEVPTPPVPDLARAVGDTVSEMTEFWVDYFNTDGAPFNYRRGTRSVRAAYKGLHRIDALTAGMASEKTVVGRISNTEIVKLAAPLAFGRRTQVFDLPPRRFVFGRNRSAGYRVPFFFVEDGVIKLYFLQPRKGAAIDLRGMRMIATIVKKHLLDIEFFGQAYEIEFVDLAAVEKNGPRQVRRYSFGELAIWSDEKLADRLTLISESLDAAMASGRIEKRRRSFRRPEPDMPLFD